MVRPKHNNVRGIHNKYTFGTIFFISPHTKPFYVCLTLIFLCLANLFRGPAHAGKTKTKRTCVHGRIREHEPETSVVCHPLRVSFQSDGSQWVLFIIIILYFFFFFVFPSPAPDRNVFGNDTQVNRVNILPPSRSPPALACTGCALSN